MPTIKIIDDNTVQFLDADGNLLAEQRYADADTALEIVDGDDNPLPIDTGPIQTPSVSTDDADIISLLIGSNTTIEDDEATLSDGVNTIYSPSGTFAPTYIAFVSPRSGGADNFSDIVHVGKDFTNRFSQFTRNNAPTRSYATSGDFGTNLDVDVSSGGFDVTVTVIGFEL
jgi:hypothetical protein